ncbi:4Fe-4S cluster-binding domain-containing protein [Myxococcota bacterium]|nr:4Fe-4S cluster-binding domain-containing protein [Myxococcota bacterium]
MSTLRPSTIIILLTRRCLYSCTHCNTFSSSSETQTFSHIRLIRTLHYLSRIKSIRTVIFSGGEPFLHYPLLKSGVFEAATLGLTPMVWTSGYFIQTREDIIQSLRPLTDVGLKGCILSADLFHQNPWLSENEELIRTELEARGCELFMSSFQMKEPASPPTLARSGDLLLRGTLPFMGRAADHIPEDMSLWEPDDLDVCPHLNLSDPTYLYLDPGGNLHLCPGIILHNIFMGHIRQYFRDFDSEKHPVIGPLLRGGPPQLAKAFNIPISGGFADQCHLCFHVRRQAAAVHPHLFPPSWYTEN